MGTGRYGNGDRVREGRATGPGEGRHQDEGEKQQQEDQGGGRGQANPPTTGGHDNLDILYTNAQSIVGKIDELSCTASELNPDLILLTETWCNDSISEAFLHIPGYELEVRLERKDTAGGRGRGLLVYSKQGLKVLTLDKVVDFNQYSMFLVNGVTIYLIYRPPSGGSVSIDTLV